MIYERLDDYQAEAVDAAIAQRIMAILFEQGTGKTWVTMGIIEKLMSDSFAGLMVVPLTNLETTWVASLSKHLPQLKLYRDFATFDKAPTPKLLLCHYEAVPKFADKAKRRKYWTFIGYDESQRLANRSSLTARMAHRFRWIDCHKVLLTGTPMDENPSAMWSQFKFLSPHLLGDTWKEWQAKWLVPVNIDLSKYRPGSYKFERMRRIKQMKEGKRPFKWELLDEFIDLLSPYSRRVDAADVLELPGIEVVDVPVTLRGKQREQYDKLERTSVLKLAEGHVTAPMRVTMIGKLHQICGGYLIDDMGEVHEVGRAKIRKLKAMIKAEEGPVVVFCRYREEAEVVRSELLDMGLEVGLLTGKVKKKDRPAIIRSFQRSKLDVMVCHVKTGGVGVDLYRASVAIFFSLTYSHIDFEQGKARVYRRGQTNFVRIYRLIAKNTIDEEIALAISTKSKVIKRVLQRLKRST